MKQKYSIDYALFRAWGMVLLALAICQLFDPVQSAEIVRMGFSRHTIGEINENDAMAAVKLWSTQLVQSNDFDVQIQAKIYEDTQSIKTALELKQIDFINLSAAVFLNLQHLLNNEQFIFAVYEDSIYTEHLLLVPQKSGITDLKDLKGSVLRFLNDPRNALGKTWLDVRLAGEQLPATEHFFSQMVPAKKISEALLPVFFGKADACLVNRKGFETMAELNPQISHQLRILEASIGYVPNFLTFRKGYESRVKAYLIDKIKTWHQTPAGYQILTIFQMDDLKLASLDILGPTMELVKKHRRLFAVDSRVNLK